MPGVWRFRPPSAATDDTPRVSAGGRAARRHERDAGPAACHPSGDVDVREIAPGEYEALAEVTVRAYRCLPGTGPSPSYERALRDVAGRARDAVVLVAVDGVHAPGAADRLLGGVTYVPGLASASAQFDDAEAAGIRMLAVDPAARRRGVGTALVRACLDRARASGKARVLLHSTPVMAAAQRLYLRLGFTRREDLDLCPLPDVRLAGFARELR